MQAKRQYLLTLQVSRYFLFLLKNKYMYIYIYIYMNIALRRFLHTIMAILRQREARNRDYALLLIWMISVVLYSAQYHRQLKDIVRQYQLTLQLSRYCLLYLKSIVIQKILDQCGITCWMTESHSSIPDYSGNMVTKFHVDWTKPAQNNKFKEPDKTQYIWAITQI